MHSVPKSWTDRHKCGSLLSSCLDDIVILSFSQTAALRLSLISLQALKVEGSMIALSHSVARISASFCAVLLMSVTGCLNPGIYQNYPGAYQQPSYAPPQTINPAGPGNLFIPQSSAPAYNPGGTFDQLGDEVGDGFGDGFGDDPQADDDFRRPANDRFFEPDADDTVPAPRDPGFNNLDDLGPGVEYRPEMFPEDSQIRQVSDVRGPGEYGFDTREYRWLRGTVQRDPKSHRWLVNYSPGRNDRHEGILSLDATGQQMIGVRSGDWIDVRGHLHASQLDRSGRPLYVVDSIVRLDP